MTNKSSLVIICSLSKLQALREKSPRNLWSQLKLNLKSKRHILSQKMKKTLNSKVMKKWPNLMKKLTEIMSKHKITSLNFLLPMVFWLIQMTLKWMMTVLNQRVKSGMILRPRHELKANSSNKLRTKHKSLINLRKRCKIGQLCILRRFGVLETSIRTLTWLMMIRIARKLTLNSNRNVSMH